MEEIKEKKIRVHILATEYNLAADSLIDFLKKKGFEVKTQNSIVTSEMLTEIQNHFKKDIEKAEKHQKKVAEFNKKMAQKTPKEEKVASIKEKVEEVPAPTPEVEIEVQPVVEEEVIQHVEDIQPKVIQDVTPSVEETIPEIAQDAIEPVVSEVQVQQETVQTSVVEPVTNKALEDTPKMKGLTVLGKMDLSEKKPVQESETAEKSAETKDDASKVIKKKKKKPKPKKKVDAPVEEPVAKKRQKVKKFEIDEKEVQEAIRKTLSAMDDSVMAGRASVRKKKKKERQEQEEILEEIRQQEQNKIFVTEFIAVNELANLMGVNVGEVITKCIALGLMVSINQRLEVETITLVADEFGFEVEFVKEYTSEVLEDYEDDEDTLTFRSPVVTIMGHVDHGKTSLLDYIRQTNVVAGESGGITQHIGAYKVNVGGDKYITFLDTPGHEAFTAMRARGAQVTDIVILVVAADDAVMPQTVEAISHALAANVPIIVAINKIDKPGANLEKIKQQLADRKVLVEDWGGRYQCVELSAKTGKNVDQLLEKILLEAEVLDLKANADRNARGIIIESELDKGRGVTSTVLVQKGTLRIGDPFVAGIFHGRVRAMFDERNKKVLEAGPATPVLVLGLEGAPQAGDLFICVDSEREAREIANKRQQLKREQDQKQVHHLTLDEISRQIKIGGVKELPLIVKGDVDGSVEALSDSLMKLSTEEVIVRVIHRGVGAISEGDVLLADASNAIIVGFHVRPNLNARKLAETQKVDIRIYSVIYDAINEVKSALEGLLSPILSEEITGTVEVRETFKVPKVGTVAGCYVLEGKISRNNKVRIIRNGIVTYEGEIGALKRFKDDVKEVDAGYECGISIHNFNDLKISDIIESFKIIETKKKLN
ncbi:MAG TPA: translation initiation factor IF-2 [Ignavibacteriaceae bacterium]|mgnify:CR=1 FL=1|nr:translation initiation factor IF-2 [Ignavibacteriaceae bacterium]